MTDGNRHRVAGSTQQRGFIDGALPMLVKRAVVAQAVLILVALWSYATAGVMPEGVVLKAV